MTNEVPPPAPPSCLLRTYSSRPDQKGGTLIAEHAIDPEEHRTAVLDPDVYRPESCPRCRHDRMHAHDLRVRTPRDLPRGSCIELRRYRCPACTSRWQVLPAFLARHLQRSWATVERAVAEAGVLPGDEPSKAAPDVPKRTLDRYAFRLLGCALVLRVALSTVGADVEEALRALGGRVSRGELCHVLADADLLPSDRRIGALAAWVHRLVPGLRLM